MVVYDDTSAEPIRIFDHGVVYEDPQTFGQYHLSYRTGDIVSPKIDTAEPIAVEMEDFIAAIRAGGVSNGHLDLALNVVRLVEAAETSLRDDRSVVPASRTELIESSQMVLVENGHMAAAGDRHNAADVSGRRVPDGAEHVVPVERSQ
jgi:hypothetical protein